MKLDDGLIWRSEIELSANCLEGDFLLKQVWFNMSSPNQAP